MERREKNKLLKEEKEEIRKVPIIAKNLFGKSNLEHQLLRLQIIRFFQNRERFPSI